MLRKLINSQDDKYLKTYRKIILITGIVIKVNFC